MHLRHLYLYGLAALLFAAGCFQDFEQFRPGQGGSGGQGTGGEGGTDPCADVDCNDDNPCTEDICDPDGNCLHPAAEVFTVEQVSNDCKELTCDGTMLVTVPDTDDEPLDDGNPCTDEVCDGDTPDHPPLPEGTTCNDTGVCNATGLCSDCLDETMCGMDTVCADFSCNAGTCEAVFNTGLVISGESDGDCEAVQCVGMNPDPVTAPLDTDIEDDGEECTADTCDMGDPVHTPINIGGGCDDGLFCTATDTCSPAGVCEGAGDPCMGNGQCADACNEAANNCFDPVGSACGSAANTACSNPDTCDGAGTCVPNHEAMGFACNDGLFCTGTDQCDGDGNCDIHSGDPCTGGMQCSDSCNETDDDCFDNSGTSCGSATDNECTNPDTCNGSGVCSVNNEPAGTACGSSADTECSNPDTCNGNGTCLVNHENAGVACGSTVDDVCTDPDTCDGSGGCLTNHAANNTPCPDTLFCDGAEVCTNGTCGATGVDPCTGGTPDCCETGDLCTDFQTDEANCGDCGVACAAGATDCNGGTCECTAGACECDGDEDCPGAETCTAGACG